VLVRLLGNRGLRDQPVRLTRCWDSQKGALAKIRLDIIPDAPAA